ncbi:DUF58 domain-containing protein [Cohnella faecalis]|uniref:DUF58 domain-containing protein n=1 Tax=Cohnella faecalis TaxID=2315694 RepID=UPI003611CF91
MNRLLFPRIWWLSGLLYVSSLLYLLFQGGKTSLMLFAILNVLGFYLLLGRWSGIGGVAGDRLVDSAGVSLLTAGNQLKVKLRMQVPGIWPIPYIIVRDKLVRTSGGESQVYELSFVPDYRRRGEVSYETAPLRRGRYRFQTTECSTRDIFGLFEHRGSFEQQADVTVMPRIIELKEWRLFRRSDRGMFQQTYSSRWAKETTQIDGVREYIHGDRFSRIHWNATAKTGQWKSKEYEREALPRVVFVLDRNAASYRTPELFELALSTAASLVELSQQKGMQIGFVSAGRIASYFGSGHARVSREEVLHHLVDAEADGSEKLGDIIGQIIERYEPGIQIILISPFKEDKTLASLSSLESRRMVPCLIHVAEQVEMPDEQNRLRLWRQISRSKQWDWFSVKKLDDLPRVLGVGSA